MLKYIYIPVELCFFAFRKHFVRQLQLFVYLKAESDGYWELSIEKEKQIAEALGLKTDRAVRKNLNALRQRNWIGFDKVSKRYFIRSYERILMQENCKSLTRAEFNLQEIKQFKAFAAGAVMCYLINQQKKQLWLAARNKRGAFPTGHSYFPISVIALKKILGVSQYTAQRLRELSVRYGYVIERKQKVKTNIKPTELTLLLKGIPEMEGKLMYKNGVVYERKPHLYFPCIRLKRGKKTKHI